MNGSNLREAYRSYYSNTISDFLQDDETRILGQLSLHHNHALEDLQKNAWVKQITILKDTLQSIDNGQIYFEFSIPRMGKRVDNVLIINDLIFVLEFKVGDNQYQKHSIEQVVDYCLDLQNFHEGSHHEKLIPVLISTKAEPIENVFNSEDNLFEPLKANQQNLSDVINKTLLQSNGKQINATDWENSIYKPTPTIIEAAQALYKGHNVKEISRHDAGAINLSKTTDCINNIIETAKRENKKSICFLTGVPGAGKTLAGLNIANERMKADEDEHAVFLSGNGPLVDVLREALTRDEVATSKENGEPLTKKVAAIKANAFIQNIHHFRDDNLVSKKAPVEKVVVFDEAQRAWAKEQVSSFMKRKKGVEDFDMSEPEFLISVMDRHEDWCTIICLIGGGQEINTGEAGVSEWLSSLKNNYPHWDIHYSNLISRDDNYLSDTELRNWVQSVATEKHELHLSVSVRSFRSEKISELMHEILEAKHERANTILGEVKNDFPILITRDLTTAKKWLRTQAKGSERIGLVASSGGRRLRPLGIDVKNDISAPNWFLNNSDDIRSSYFLEEIATEFDIQGLEIDWVCLAWDINYFFKDGKWNCQYFSGTKWQNIHNENDKTYLQNAYRVLLTRARQGLIIYIPEGDDLDHTRPKELYDSTFNYFQSCGLKTI
ncbi:DUF2075 domain-containing protein [Polaribacter sp. BAL334]|uniref:DUF2075 domain-containing protein n=1 Tax=Polaribacter sp. BAL334 TaxID=1708178 RepID=UPI0018D206EA|nr:DUF2075 domain-containing protein [Polaribacter sp. BAL334]MBG7612967.1 DUF2075 domain-containing protein [Polaribacter sp. BAL334]